jgi:uncharacterized membrane protein YheB (UPF0754 family)
MAKKQEDKSPISSILNSYMTEEFETKMQEYLQRTARAYFESEFQDALKVYTSSKKFKDKVKALAESAISEQRMQTWVDKYVSDTLEDEDSLDDFIDQYDINEIIQPAFLSYLKDKLSK